MKLSSFNLSNSSHSLRLYYKRLSEYIVNDSSCFTGVVCYEFTAVQLNEVGHGNTKKYTFDSIFSYFAEFIIEDVLNYSKIIFFSFSSQIVLTKDS